MLEKILESPLNCKEIKPVNPKGSQPLITIGRTDIEAPIHWSPDAKNWHIWKDPDAGKDWRQEEKGTTEDEMVGWHHWLGGHEFGQAPGVGDGQGSLTCCSPWACKELDMTEWLNWTELMVFPVVMYGCESWTVMKAEHWRIDAFEIWCWRRLLRIPWTARKSTSAS